MADRVDRTCLIILIGVFGLIKQTGSQGPGSGAFNTPKDCSRHRLDSLTGFRLVCDLRTINSEFDKTNFSVIPALGTTALEIRCEESLTTESRIFNGSFYHLSELEELGIQHCNLISTPTGSFDGLKTLRNLSLQTYPEEDGPGLRLDPGALASLPNLNRIDLSHSGLEDLPTGEMCELSSLTHLNISHNRITEVPRLGLTSSSSSSCELSVGLLDVSYNSIESLDSGDLQSLPHLRALFLANNRITQVHDGALRGLSSLRTLDLSHNQIVALPGSIFQDTPELRQLKMENNRLSVISTRVFHALPELMVLDLAHNRLETPCLTCRQQPCKSCLSQRSFNGLNKLIILNLANNRIQHLQKDFFEDLGNLQILDMSSNLIDSVPSHTFRGLRNLHTLKVSANQIRSLEPDSLAGVSSLITLGLENNSISTIADRTFANLSMLQDLNLFDNQLRRVPAAMRHLHTLKTVDLGKNGIADINATALQPLNSLFGLKLDENEIETVTPASLANLTGLQILNLASNRISEVERGAFNANRRLQAVRLDSNRIADIVGLFSELPNLRWLNISANRIQKFDYFLLPMSLNWLDIHGNEIADIGNYFDKEAELNITTLDFSFNQLKTINAKSIPDKVQILSLNDNLITRVDPLTFASKKHLVRVDLFANQIVKLETSSISLPAGGGDGHHRSSVGGRKSGKPEFYLGGNPFLCDCNLEWLKSINNMDSSVNYPVVKDLESIYCRLMYSHDDGGSNAYIPLVDARTSDFLCSYTAHCFALCHCCDFDACDCEMTCPENCTCYHDQSWSTNIVDCSTSQFTEPPTTIPMDATEVYLHGNNFPILASHSFIGRKKLRALYLNNSNIEAVLNYTFYGLKRLEALHMEHNNIQRLQGYEFATLQGLKALYLDHNQISWIEWSTFTHLASLEVLRLDNNRLYTFPGHFSLGQNPYLVEVSLSANPWSCDCQLVSQFNGWLMDNTAKVVDVSQIACFPNNSDTAGAYIMDSFDDCSVSETITLIKTAGGAITDFLPLIIVVASILTVVSVALGVVIYYRTELRVWAFSQWGSRLCYASPPCDADTEKMYDAYISYSLKDENFVNQVLSPELEHGDPSHRLCLHYRDFPHNSYVADSIVEAVATSRRTVVVLSKNFLIHEWSRYDVKSALHDVLKSGSRGGGKSIILVLGEVPHRELDPDLRIILKSNTTIHWSDRMFWEKLRFYLPPGSLRPPLQHYSLPIYEVPHLPNHLTLNSNHHHHHHQQNKIYEQRTLESQLTAKLY